MPHLASSCWKIRIALKPHFAAQSVKWPAVVHVYGSTAVLNRFTLHEQFTDSDIVIEMRETETYAKRLLASGCEAMGAVAFKFPQALD